MSVKTTFSMIQKFFPFEKNDNEIESKLNSIGLEVDQITNRDDLKQFTIAKIIDCTKHENADKLKICKVDIGKGEILDIVCGAKNARAGITVVFAKIGTIIPKNNMEIKKAKIRGKESCGMLCSASELLIDDEKNTDGIYEIDDTPAPIPGTNFAKFMGFDDRSLHLSVTPNRADCFSAIGIARDMAAGFSKTINDFKVNELKGEFDSKIKIKSIDKKICHGFYGLYIRGLENKKSPKWLSSALSMIGTKSHSLIVDVTNYVMYLLGQPLHAYDANKIGNSISVKKSKKGTKFIDLKGNEHILNDTCITVCDDKSIIGLGGVMGGMESGSSMDTTDIFLEGAIFDKIYVSKTYRHTNIITDSKLRFERGIDPDMTKKALYYAASIIQKYCGGSISKIVANDYIEKSKPDINFSLKQFHNLIGFNISKKDTLKILSDLKFKAKVINDDMLQIAPPSWRHDINISQDIAEEILRIKSYDIIPEEKINMDQVEKSQNSVLCDENFNNIEICKKTLISNGYIECINFSFIKSDKTSYDNNIIISNPISENMDMMRDSILPSLLSNYFSNHKMGEKEISFFESGDIFSKQKDKMIQKGIIAGIRSGHTEQNPLHGSRREFDIFDIKNDIAAIMSEFNITEYKIVPFECEKGIYNPYAAAKIVSKENIEIGRFGELHPLYLAKFDKKAKSKIHAFEIENENLFNKKIRSKKPPYIVYPYPAVEKDFSFIMDTDIISSEIINEIIKIDKRIKKAYIFDIHKDEKQIGPGKKSLSIKTIMQSQSETLDTKTIDNIFESVIKNITKKFNAILRDHKIG